MTTLSSHHRKKLYLQVTLQVYLEELSISFFCSLLIQKVLYSKDLVNIVVSEFLSSEHLRKVQELLSIRHF